MEDFVRLSQSCISLKLQAIVIQRSGVKFLNLSAKKVVVGAILSNGLEMDYLPDNHAVPQTKLCKLESKYQRGSLGRVLKSISMVIIWLHMLSMQIQVSNLHTILNLGFIGGYNL